MANSLNRVFAPEPVVAGPPANPVPSTSVSVDAQTTLPTTDSTEDQPVKRKRGRPKGSTSKKPAEDRPPDSSDSKSKRPVGRPRKDGLPAGSVPKRTSAKRQKVSVDSNSEPAHHFGWGVSYVSPPHATPYPTTALSHHDEWRQLAQTRPPHDLIAALLTTFAAPNPTSTVGPTLEEAFKIHLQSLAPNPSLDSSSGSPSTHNIPSLYSILKTFWLPASPAYFTMAASASNTRMAMEYRFLYWDPQPLVFNGIQCPFCPSFLANNGRILSGPIKIYDIGKPFFIIGCEYICTSPQCMGASSSSSSPSEGRKFGSTDASIMNSLPKGLKDEFPAKLLYADSDAGSAPNVWNWNAMGVSTALWNLVVGALGIGMRKEAIVHLVRSMQHGPPEIKYELKEEETSVSDPVRADDEDEKEDDTPDPDTPGNSSPSFTQSRPHNQSTSTNPGPSQPSSTTQAFHSPHTSPHTSHPPSHPQHHPPYQPSSHAIPRSHPHQPQQQQPRQSPAFAHYSYSQYPYHPDHQSTPQQAPPRPTSATTATTAPPGAGAGAGVNAPVRGAGSSK
ncbi:hypothetical protein JOM56_015324 [Amanita muscaria]